MVPVASSQQNTMTSLSNATPVLKAANEDDENSIELVDPQKWPVKSKLKAAEPAEQDKKTKKE